MTMEKEVGRLGGLIEGMEKDIAEVKGDVKSLLAAEAKRQGAWRVTLGAGAFAGAAVAFFANLLEVLLRKN